MAIAALGASNNQAQTSGSAPSAGMNPFWSASNWYAEKNNQGVLTQALGASQVPIFINVNPGQFIRDIRLIVRTSSAGTGTATADAPWSTFSSLDLEDTDGAEIIFQNTGYYHMLMQMFGRPWWGNPSNRYDFASGASPSFTLALPPEIRFTLGTLLNTDSRSLYRVTGAWAPANQVVTGTGPTLTLTTYMDAWAQPDDFDLDKVPNQPLPPGAIAQTKRRRANVVMNNAGASNILQGNQICGNLLRLVLLCVRDTNGVRQDAFTDPIRWRLDNKQLGTFSPDMLFQWLTDFYSPQGLGSIIGRPTGVYPFPRFFDPGTLQGQGWLETNNATSFTWETTTAGGFTGPGTVDILSDEVVPVGTIPSELWHL